MMKKLLEIKKKIKSKLPTFSRKDSHKKVRIGSKWRKPKGIQNKMRLQLRAHKKIVKAGYRTPNSLRHLTDEGMNVISVSNLKELEKVNSKEDVVIISSSVSNKTRLSMIEFALSKNIKIENLRDAKKKAEKIKADYQSRKETSQKIISSRKAKKEKLESVKKKEDKKEDKKAEKDETKEAKDEKKVTEEKKEKNKVLTKKS